jgi:hypothetical protein
MRTLLSIILLVFVLLVCSGCGTQLPEELKNLAPVTITVMDGSQPLEGVAVALNSKGGAKGFFVCTGVTDAKGVAKIESTRSSCTGKGAPPGTYSVVLVKPVDIPPELEPREEDQDNPAAATARQAKLNAFLKEKQAIPMMLTQSTSSPVELTVMEKSGATAEIDISKYR